MSVDFQEGLSTRLQQGQSTLEFALLIAVVIGALLSMQVYMKRGIHGKLKESADQIGEQFHAANASWNITRGSTGTTVDTSSFNGLTKTQLQNVNQTRNGSENTVGLDINNEKLVY